MEQTFGEPISRGFECPCCRELLKDGQSVCDTKIGAMHRECYEVTLTLVQEQKRQQGLLVPPHLNVIDVTPLGTYARTAGAVIKRVLELRDE